MKSFVNLILLFAVLLFISPDINAQLELPRISQKASVWQKIGLLEITVNYSRPNVKGREIWGGLVPYNEVWRTGADEATTILFSEDCTLNGNKIPAGKYGFFTIPGKDEWIVIINKVSKQWGAFFYDSTKDLIRFKVKPVSSDFTESMLFYFSDVTVGSANLDLTWEYLKIPLKIEFDIDAKAYSNIKKAIADEPDNWVYYAAGANYAVDNNIHLDEAMEWINKSISIQESYYNYFVKAKLLDKMNKINDAIQYVKKAIAIGKGDPEFKNDAPQINLLLKQLKEKKNNAG